MSVRENNLVPLLLFLAGSFLLAAGLLWPAIADPRANWSPEQAQAYAEVSASLHESAHGHPESVSKEEYEAIRERFSSMKTELEGAREKPKRIALLLKWGGAALAAGGVLVMLGQRKNS